MRRLFIFTVCAFILLIAFVYTACATGPLKILINGREAPTGLEPQMVNGKEYTVHPDSRKTEANVVKISEANDRQAIEIHKGQFLQLTLPGNQSTGYTWFPVQEVNSQILKEIFHEFIPDSKLVGAGGVEKWKYEIIGEGSTSLTLQYCRPWESVQPLKTYSVDIKATFE